MPPVITGFQSTEFRPANLCQFEDFVVTRFNPLVNHETGVILNGHVYLSSETRKPMTAKKAATLLWARSALLPIQARKGRHGGTVHLIGSGDSDNGDDFVVDDSRIKEVSVFIPDDTVVAFEFVKYPSNDSDDPGGVWYWVYLGKDLAARLSRGWTRHEVESGKREEPSLDDVFQAFQCTRGFALGLFRKK